MIAIGGAARGVNKSSRSAVARSDQHVDKADDIGGGRRDRVGDAAWDETERRLVQHIIDAIAGAATAVQIADVALDEFEARPL